MKINNLQKDLKSKKAVYGINNSLKKIKTGKADVVYIASNCPSKNDIINYSRQQKIDLVEMKENNMELGILCKKPHSVSVLCFEK